MGTRTFTQQLHPPHDTVSSKDHDLDYQLDGRKKTIKVGGQTFDLHKGKYFVVALDKTWRTHSTQLKDDLKAAPLPTKTPSLRSKSPLVPTTVTESPGTPAALATIASDVPLMEITAPATAGMGRRCGTKARR